MVQLLTPIDPLSHKLRTSSFRCTPLTRRRTLPTIRDLALSHSWRQNAIERAAVRKITGQLSHLPNLASFISVPEVISTEATLAPPAGVSVQAEILPQEIPGTPATPLESDEHYPKPEHQHEPKANIFDNTTKSSEALLDLTMAALERIYVDDYSEAAWVTESQPQVAVPVIQVTSWPQPRSASLDYEQSPPPFCPSSISSALSTPSSSLPTPHSFSPAFDPEIAYACQTESARAFPSKVYTASVAAAGFNTAKPLARTQSVPVNTRPIHGPTLGDKTTLRWFLVELLRRSRASATVVQLALHYLAQARVPVGGIIRERFNSGPRQGQQDGGEAVEEESPLLDPRRLLLAAVMLSTKLLHDHAPNNRAWARVCGLAPRDVGACERALGKALDWKLANMLVGPRDDQELVLV